MKRHKLIFLLLVLLMFSSFSGGCRQEKKQETTITLIHAWGGTEKDHTAMRQIYQDFQKKNPDIKLQMISMPTLEEMERKVEDMIMVGKIPDIVSFSGIGQNSIYDYMVDHQLAVDLSPYLREDTDFAESVSQVHRSYWTREDGSLYTVADVQLLSGGYWYNEDILSAAGIEKLPENWDQFEEMCRQIQGWSVREQKGIQSLQPSSEGYLYCLDHMLATCPGASVLTGKIQYSDQNFRDAMERLKRIYRSTELGNMAYTYRDETQLFNEGKLAIDINGVWASPMIDAKIKVKYALLPSDENQSVSCQSSSLGYLIGRSENSKREEAAVRFLKYMLSPEVQTEILDRTEQIPANSKISLEPYRDQKTRLYQAVSEVLAAKEKIEVPNNMWPGGQAVHARGTLLDALDGKISTEALERELKDKDRGE